MSWEPEQCALYLGDWDRVVYMTHRPSRDMAMSIAPDGRSLMFEKCCTPAVVARINQMQVVQDLPIGAIKPLPKGTRTVNLRRCPPNTKPTVFTINEWHFCNVVHNLDNHVADQLEEMHNRWYNEEYRRLDDGSVPDYDMGEVRR